jgi:hypothetical protein
MFKMAIHNSKQKKTKKRKSLKQLEKRDSLSHYNINNYWCYTKTQNTYTYGEF